MFNNELSTFIKTCTGGSSKMTESIKILQNGFNIRGLKKEKQADSEFNL